MNSSWKFGRICQRFVASCVTLSTVRKSHTDPLRTRFGCEESNDPASLQLLFVSKFIGPVYCQGNCCRGWSSIAFLVSEIRILFGLLTFKVVTGFLFLFISFVAAWRNNVMTCNNVPEFCYRLVSRHDLRCLAVSTRNRLGDGSFEGGLDGIWTGYHGCCVCWWKRWNNTDCWSLCSQRVIWPAGQYSSCKSFMQWPVWFLYDLYPSLEAIAVALGGFDGGWMTLDIC